VSKALVATPDDIEAALAAYENDLFQRSAEVSERKGPNSALALGRADQGAHKAHWRGCCDNAIVTTPVLLTWINSAIEVPHFMDILTKREGGVMTIELNRPHKKNAITADMYAALAAALIEAREAPEIRAVMIVGKRDVFTAGNDLQDFMDHPPGSDDSPVFRFLREISHAPKPLVAAVSGAAIGVGTTMLLHCDLVFAGDNARFSLPFAQLGLVPEAASSLLLPELFGYQRAAERLLLGEPFGADEALRMGLVNAVLPADAVVGHARLQADKLVALPAAAVRATKRLMKQGRIEAIDSRMLLEGEEFRERLRSPEAREAFAAFFERRRPDFSRFD
jgi:enoyl-CoA hydratase/carnithine racemase